MRLAKLAIVSRDSLAVVGIGAALELVDQVADRQRVLLGGAENNGFLALVDLVEQDLYPLLLALLYLDDAVELGFPLCQ